MNRREFLRKSASLAAGLFVGLPLLNCRKELPEGGRRRATRPVGSLPYDLVVAENGTPAGMVEKAIKQLGGMEKFVLPGSWVVLKPNIAFAAPPESAGDTNPELVAAVVKLCRRAKAKRITVVDHTIDHWKACLNISGIKRAAEEAGAEVYAAYDESLYTEVDVPKGKKVKREKVITDVLEADVFINLPIAKNHSAATAVVGLKNLMGTIWEPRKYHTNRNANLHQCIADLNTLVRADLTIADCYRVLLTNGPKPPGEVGKPGKIVVGVDPVAVDAYCTRFLGLKPRDVEYISLAEAAGLGQTNVNKLRIKTVSLS